MISGAPNLMTLHVSNEKNSSNSSASRGSSIVKQRSIVDLLRAVDPLNGEKYNAILK